MFKKAAAVAIAAAGVMMVGSPAFADPWYDTDQFFPGSNADQSLSGTKQIGPDHESERADQLGLLNLNLLNFNDDSDLLSNINALCNLDVNVLAIPVLQGNDGGPLVCGNTDDDTDVVVDPVLDDIVDGDDG